MKNQNFKDRNFLLIIFYQGPWERLSNFCYGIRSDTTLRWDVPDNPKGWRRWLAKIGDWAERRDAIWRAKLVIKRKEPDKRWSRREG